MYRYEGEVHGQLRITMKMTTEKWCAQVFSEAPFGKGYSYYMIRDKEINARVFLFIARLCANPQYVTGA